MFETLTERFRSVFRTWKTKGKLTEKDIDEGLKEVKRALIEADVHLKVVKYFVQEVKRRALEQPEIFASLTPEQHLIKIVRDTLTDILGETLQRFEFPGKPLTIILLVGLQGSGKTTTAAKLAVWTKEHGQLPALVSADVYRPAAIKQLEILAQQAGCPFISTSTDETPESIARKALREAKIQGYTTLIVDTAGRLHIDDAMMREAKLMKDILNPHWTLFVADAMTGQDAVRSARAFHKNVEFDGVILTKMDGDARGGAALSVKVVTGKPILFVGVSEKLDGIEPFHPDRMAERILGMGDILTLIEKAEKTWEKEEAQKLQQKILKEEFTFEELLDQFRMIRKLGSLQQLAGLIPGFSGDMLEDFDERELKRMEAIILSMTPQERRYPRILNGSRKKRIARGSGTTVQEVNQLIRLLRELQSMTRQMKKSSWMKQMRRFMPF